MRVLLKAEDGSCLVIEISEMYYDEKRLIMVDYEGDVLFIPEVNYIIGKQVCHEILRNGYVDLYAYGSYDIEEEE